MTLVLALAAVATWLEPSAVHAKLAQQRARRGKVAAGGLSVGNPSKKSSKVPAKKALVVTPNQRGRFVVLSFRNDEGGNVSRHVGRLLEARGLSILTDVKPVDTAEQFRDVATALGLAGFFEGEVRQVGKQVRVTVRLRNGYTGRRVAEARVQENPFAVADALTAKVWTRLGPATARACADADRPRRASRSTLRINAGTPIETVPASEMADR